MHYSDLICGLHSNIPLCCVIWYLNGWESIPHDNYYIKNTYYVQCPNCVANIIEKNKTPNKTKRCNCTSKVYIKHMGDPINGVDLIDMSKVHIRNDGSWTVFK